MENNISRDKILDAIAPCAFCCYTCAGKKGGVIEETSKKLSHYLEGYYEFNKSNLPLKHRGYSKKIKEFKKRLDKMSDKPCNGCRNGADEKCCIPNCFILECAKLHKADFCGECDEFPCSKGEEFFKGLVLKEWKANNERIKRNGAEDYYEFATSRSHYQFYG